MPVPVFSAHKNASVAVPPTSKRPHPNPPPEREGAIRAIVTAATFATRLITWQRRHGRHDLPWQNTRDAYRIWLSEIMLQQTQVVAVLRYYERFLERFPSVESLATAPLSDVMPYWAGLGYYSRARNLHRAAQTVVTDFNGQFPPDPAQLLTLPGIGRSTAAAITAFAYGTRAAILDGNVKRVFARHFGIAGFPGEKTIEQQLWTIAERELPLTNIEIYTQGLMDLGATLCTRTQPDCAACPVHTNCIARRDGRISELPTPRPKKAIPHRILNVLVIVCQNAVLLEERPPVGIWGGLLSLPEIAEADLPGQHPLRTALPQVEHGFTHYSVSIKPWRIDIPPRKQLSATKGYGAAAQWISLNELNQAALPAPVKRILLALQVSAAHPRLSA